MQPSLVIIGLNYRTASLDVRERFWISESRRYEAIHQLVRSEGIDEAVVLSTPHRTEFILWASDASSAANSVLRLLTREYDLKMCEWSSFYRLLDEAALICPIPLDEWTADMGGRNITMHIAAQSRAQLRHRWQDTGAAAILNNAGTVLLFGGTRDPDDLHAYATLIGERDEPVKTYDRDGRLVSTTVRRSPVLSPSQLAQLPAGRVVIIRRGMPPAVGTALSAPAFDVLFSTCVAPCERR